MLMSFLQKSGNIKTKLSILVTTAVLLVVIVLGFYFDGFIKDSFLENTRTRMHHGYERLSYNLRNIEINLKEGISFARSNEKMIASIQLINNYQDKNNYNTYLIDEEKKLIASQLLNRVKLSFNEDIALYDLNHELVAFVTKEKQGYRLAYISYDKGQANLYQREESGLDYALQDYKIPANISIEYKQSDAKKNSTLTYHHLDDRIVIKAHQNIFNNGSAQAIGFIEMSRILDKTYFERFSDELDLKIYHSFDLALEAQAGILKNSIKAQHLNIIQTDLNFTVILKQDSLDGPIYYLVNLNKIALNSLLNESRTQFFLLLIFVAISIMLLMRFLISRSLGRPLSELMQQIHKIECQDYSASKPISSGDELEEISISINQLALAVQERETSLEVSKDELEYLSNHDVLTDLPNRRVFSQRLQHALDLASRNHVRLAVFFMDLDQFKLINDTLGHDVGDELLIQVSKRLIQHVRSSDTLARIGGDEFNILIEDAPDKLELQKIVQKYMSLFEQAFHCCGHIISVTVSVGIAVYPEDGEDSVSLLKHADLAMYSSKDCGRNNYKFFSNELSADAIKRMNLIHDLEMAIESFDQFELHYQPKVLAGSHKIASFEALLRWNRPKHGLIKPDSFISLAEETGLIVPIGQWVLQQACQDFSQLHEEGIELQHVSINISNIQMKKSNMLESVQQAINLSGIKNDQIELEITESYIATDVAHALETLHTFHDMGVGLAIDDFGTGYSSMNYLHKLPITRLKIDKSFVDGLPNSKDSSTIVLAIIGLAKSFNLAITAEGVEHEGQLQFLENAECDEIQGYYFSKPLSLNDFRKFYTSKMEDRKKSELKCS